MANIEQPSGYNFDVKGKLLKEHECPICLMLIRNATELPCTHLMCRDCLMYFEENELERNENADFLCSLCQQAYHRNEKKEVRSHDRIIRESLDVKCKNWKDGCDWVGSISYYEDHHINVCELLMVECPNNGCKEQMQRRAIFSHQESCEYRIVTCEHCHGEFPICWLKDHHETCPSYPVVCQNSGCDEFVPKKQMEDHRMNECQHQVIPCIYSEVGCTIQLPRHAIASHHQEAMQRHTFLLLKSHVNLSKKNEELEQKLGKSNKTIEQLQKTVKKQEESIEKQKAEITCLQNDVKKHEELKVEEKLTNLETFAKQSADFFEMLTKKSFFLAAILSSLSQKDYDDDEIVKKFKNSFKEIVSNEADCPYLQTLSGAVKNCYEDNYPTTYKDRVRRVALKMEKDRAYFNKGSYYIRIDLYICKKVFIKTCNTIGSFKEEMNKNAKWNRRSLRDATYYDYADDCYYVAFFSTLKVKNVWLLHNNDEKQNKKLKINDKTDIEWVSYVNGTYFIFQINE